MLVVFIRTVIIYLCLVVGVRLMGKRTIGELQPFEFTITLAVADLACMPMQDISVPLIYGLVPLFTMFLLHYFITILSGKSIKFRRFLNGKPVIVIDDDGINYKALNALNLNVNDLLESIRSQQFFSPEQIKFAVYETNGNLSLMERSGAPSLQGIPITIIVEGRFMESNMVVAKVNKDKVIDFLDKRNLRFKDVLLLTIDGNRYFLQPKGKHYLSEIVDD